MATGAYNKIHEATILSGQTNSSVVDLSRALVFGVELPVFTGATFKIQNSSDGVNFVDMKNSTGGAIYDSITATDSSYIDLDTTITGGFRYIKIISASSEAADRTIKIYSRLAM